MERPAKRQKLSSSESWPSPTQHADPDGERSCTHADAKTEGSGGRPVVPTPTLHQHDFRRRYLPDGSIANGRNQLPRRQQPAPIVPRAPDTTVVATAVDVNVQVGNTTVTNTLVLQATDATVVSFTSLGVLTVAAQTTASVKSTAATLASGSSRTSASSVSTGASPATGGVGSSTSPTLSLPPGYNSSATATSDRTTTITSTSTLNVSFLNGTLVPITNPSDTNGLATASFTSHPDRSTDAADGSTVASTASPLSTLTPTASTESTGNGASAAPSLGGAGPAGSGSPTMAVSSATSPSSAHGGSALGPATPAVVGGVVGGVAGMACLLLILLALLRWYRKRLQSRGLLPEQRAAPGRDPSGATQMSSQSSQSPLATAILSSTRRWRPQSSATTATAVTTYSTVPTSERGFQRIAGRKIAPVLANGADQYGGNYGAFEKDFPDGRLTRGGPAGSAAGTAASDGRDLAGSSFYRDSQGFYGGKGDPPPASPTLVSSSLGHTRGSTRDWANPDSVGEDPRDGALEGYAVMRPSPARTPMTSSPSHSSLRLPIQQGPTMEPGAPPTPALPSHLVGRRPDGVGRSLSSLDGSRGSRFTESV